MWMSQKPLTPYFYPRPPRGGRLFSPIAEQRESQDFYPRPPRGGRPIWVLSRLVSREISIHALREEGDPVLCGAAPCSSRFLSTPSARRATGDKARYKLALSDFYPRPPRGGRPSFIEYKTVDDVFLSTPSARRATWRTEGVRRGCHISIHALREEGDSPSPV